MPGKACRVTQKNCLKWVDYQLFAIYCWLTAFSHIMKLFLGLVTVLSVTLHAASLAQNASSVGGESASGLRLGGASGVTYKKYSTSNRSAFEAIASYSFDPKAEGLGITALYEKLAPLAGKRLAAQIGVGPTWVFRDAHIGVTGLLGFDWRLPYAPVTLSVDWAPTFFFINRTGFSPVNGAFSARYVLNSRRYSLRKPGTTTSPSK